jgi:hypothetical protein
LQSGLLRQITESLTETVDFCGEWGMMTILQTVVLFFMNNSHESLFSAAIKEATYFDVNCLMNLFHGADGAVEYWSLMQPDNLRQIIVSTEQRLLKICLQCLKETYESSLRQSFSTKATVFKPSVEMIAEVKSFISIDLNIIGQEINQYEYSYQLFASSRQKYENGLIRVHGGQQPVMSGGARESLLYQSVPPEIELNAAQQEFERRNQQISIKFSDTLQKTTNYLEAMQSRTMQTIASYRARWS